MTSRIVVTVTAAGMVTAHTKDMVGPRCLDYVAVLERLLEAQTVESSYTADYTRVAAEVRNDQEARNVDRA